MYLQIYRTIVVPNNESLTLKFVLINEGESTRKSTKMFTGKTYT